MRVNINNIITYICCCCFFLFSLLFFPSDSNDNHVRVSICTDFIHFITNVNFPSTEIVKRNRKDDTEKNKIKFDKRNEEKLKKKSSNVIKSVQKQFFFSSNKSGFNSEIVVIYETFETVNKIHL